MGNPGPSGTQNPDLPTGDQVQDLGRVHEAVQNAGGAPTQKPPDLAKIAPRVGQDLEVIDSVIDYEQEDFSVPDRPEESNLRRLTHTELLPPPSSRPVPLDLDFDPSAPEFVSQQKIEFLILMKSDSDPSIPWGFPDKATLQALLVHVRDICDHDQIMEAVSYTHLTLPTIYSV